MTTTFDATSPDFAFLDQDEAPVIKQGSAQWLELRIGKITGSRIKDVMAYLKSGKGEMQARANYRIELIAEILSGRAQEHFISDAMRWGVEQEQFARAAYEVRFETIVDQVGFIQHPSMDFAGGSPDGLIGDDGGIEIKCPETITHIKWLLAGQVPEEHYHQMMFYMACSGRKWWDFISFDSRLPEKFQLFRMRLERDDTKIAEIESEVRKFRGEIETAITEMERLAA